MVEDVYVSDSDDSVVLVPYTKPKPPTISLVESDHEEIIEDEQISNAGKQPNNIKKLKKKLKERRNRKEKSISKRKRINSKNSKKKFDPKNINRNRKKRRKTREQNEEIIPPPLTDPDYMMCIDFPDCLNQNKCGNACYKVDLSREEHRLLLQVDEEIEIMKKLRDKFSNLDVKMSLLQKTTQIHLSGKDYDDVRDKMFQLMYKLKSMGREKYIESVIAESMAESTTVQNVQNTSSFSENSTPPCRPQLVVQPLQNSVTNENPIRAQTRQRGEEWTDKISTSQSSFGPVNVDTTLIKDIDERELPPNERVNLTLPIFSPNSPFYYPLGYADFFRGQYMTPQSTNSSSFSMDTFAHNVIKDESNKFFAFY